MHHGLGAVSSTAGAGALQLDCFQTDFTVAVALECKSRLRSIKQSPRNVIMEWTTFILYDCAETSLVQR